jgi:hypothetical protein
MREQIYYAVKATIKIGKSLEQLYTSFWSQSLLSGEALTSIRPVGKTIVSDT